LSHGSTEHRERLSTGRNSLKNKDLHDSISIEGLLVCLSQGVSWILGTAPMPKLFGVSSSLPSPKIIYHRSEVANR
jgi:hypothetical protein